MIKIIIKESKELKTANTDLLKKISDFVSDCKSKNLQTEKYYNISLEELLYLDINKSFGLPFFYFYHVLGDPSSYKNIKKFWNKEKQAFNEDFIAKLKKQFLPIKVKTVIDPSVTAIAKAGAATTNGNSVFLMIAYLNNINTNTFTNKVAHEFRHFTQRTNDICIYYAEQLKKVKDPTKVKMEDIQKIPDKFGLGKQQTGILKTYDPKDKFAAAAGDKEYETYLADLVQSYYQRLMKTPEVIENDIKTLGSHAAAVKYIKLLFSTYRYKNSYSNINGILQKILEKRPEELPKDMLALLSNRFSGP